MPYWVISIVGITTEIHSPRVTEMNQPTSEPSKGIDTSPTVFRPCILCTHDQHAANYVRIMIKSGMSLPLGED